MTQQEFETLTGWEVSQEEYAEYDAMYLASGDMDKKTFCEDLKKHKGSKIIKELAETCDRRQRYLADAQGAVERTNKECMKLREELANLMMVVAHQTGRATDREKAIEYCGGTKQYILKKMNQRYTLTEEDLKDVKSILEEK